MWRWGPPGYLTVRTLKRRTARSRRQVRRMSRSEMVWVKWSCFELGIRYYPRRGWRPISLVRLFGPGYAPWSPATLRCDCEEEVFWSSSGRG